MKLFDRLQTHADLMHQMAHTVGADLGDAVLSGTVSGQELRTAVIRCTRCAGGRDCPNWLETHADGAPATPSYCENSDMLMRVKNS